MKLTQYAKRGVKKILGPSLATKLKNMNQPKLEFPRATVHRIAREHLSTGWTTVEREQMLEIALIYLGSSHIYGNYAEFGTWRGDTFATAYHFSEYLSPVFPKFNEMKFFGLDSFEGFPELSEGDDFPQFQKGGRFCSIEDFIRLMEEKKVDMSRVRTVKGWFNKTLVKGGDFDRNTPDQSISIAWIDCDLYESTAEVLEFLHPKMIPGGIMIFDDWFCFAGDPAKGEQRAVTEMLDRYPNLALAPFRTFNWHGNSFTFQRYDSAETVKKLREKNLVL